MNFQFSIDNPIIIDFLFQTKFRLLEENRVKVLTQQLDKLQTALAAYFSGTVGDTMGGGGEP